ncbi:MAG: homoserine O-acetyltransferase [Proteobacteria bacterium]|nr:homoserine O-acetyltransferase [Pseudomonadota bacterium]
MTPDVAEGVHELPGGLALHHGGALPSVRVAWRLEGPVGAPVVVAMGGISAHRRIAGRARAGEGWWPELAGPGLPLDSSRFRLLGFDYLGGSGDTTGPVAGAPDFPPVSSYDQATVLLRLCDLLGVPSLHAIVGASYGGMVALAFAERHPERVARILVISAAHRTNPLATAWRSIEREAVRFGLSHGDGPGGLRLARALAMATYRTRQEFERRFDDPPEVTGTRAVFPVERYLLARGDDYARRYAPGAFMCLSESIDLHRVAPESIKVPATLVGVTEDQLVTIDEMRELESRLTGPRRLYEIHSLFGHDAFLKERVQLAPLFAQALDGDAR